jgi:CrcB protein
VTRLLVIGLGGFVGAVARYGLSGWVQSRSTSPVPWGTMSVNVLGCLLLGALMAYAKDRPVGTELQFFLRVGVLGAFTTFSTLGYETVELFSSEQAPCAGSSGEGRSAPAGEVRLARRSAERFQSLLCQEKTVMKSSGNAR